MTLSQKISTSDATAAVVPVSGTALRTDLQRISS
jgi:hypothetical protein